MDDGYHTGWQYRLPYPGTRLPDLRATLLPSAHPYGTQMIGVPMLDISDEAVRLELRDTYHLNVTLSMP